MNPHHEMSTTPQPFSALRIVPPHAGGPIYTSGINVNDVLCGGSVHRNHSGNRRYHILVKHFEAEYCKARSTDDKNKISRAIVAAVRNARWAGRFLQKSEKEENIWYELGDKKAWDKTSDLLRDYVSISKHHDTTKVYPERINNKEVIEIDDCASSDEEEVTNTPSIAKPVVIATESKGPTPPNSKPVTNQRAANFFQSLSQQRQPPISQPLQNPSGNLSQVARKKPNTKKRPVPVQVSRVSHNINDRNSISTPHIAKNFPMAVTKSPPKKSSPNKRPATTKTPIKPTKSAKLSRKGGKKTSPAPISFVVNKSDVDLVATSSKSFYESLQNEIKLWSFVPSGDVMMQLVNVSRKYKAQLSTYSQITKDQNKAKKKNDTLYLRSNMH